jgi:murein DD-endopeptidase MepM/ murein hydrolase activator NlpD
MSTSASSSIQHILNQQISYAVYHLPAGTYSLPDDSGKLSQELLIGLGLIERTSAPPTIPPPAPVPSSADTDADAKSDAKSDAKARTRTVSKKMKDAFLASPGKTEDDLKRVSKAYKAATDADIAAAGGDFVSFGNRVLASAASATPSTPPPAKAKADKPPAAPKEKKEKKEKTKPRLAWSAAEKKVFKDVVTDVTEDIKAEFAAYIDAKSDEDFKAFAMAGHMRAWFDARITPCAGAGHHTPAQHDLIRSMENLNVSKEDADDNEEADEDADEADEDADEEDLLDILINEEQLLIGSKTGDIFQPCEAGDIKLGTAGVGKYKDVKIPKE